MGTAAPLRRRPKGQGLALVLATSVVVSACRGEEVVPAPPAPSISGSAPAAATTTSAVPAVTAAPPLSVPPPTCSLDVSPASAPAGSQITLTVRSNLPRADVTILIRLPTETQTRKARTDGGGVALENLPALRAAAGRRIPVEVSLPVGPVSCATSYLIT